MEDLKKKIYFTGVRGIACVLIVIHHLIIKLYPATYTGDLNMIQTSGGIFELGLAQSWIGFLINGNFWVMVFITLSGFGISLGLYKRKIYIREVPKLVLKRYLRLMLPILVYSLITYTLFSLGLNNYEKIIFDYNHSPYILSSSDFLSKGIMYTIWQGCVGIVLLGNTAVRGAYWVIQPLFLGGIGAIVITIIIKSNTNKLNKFISITGICTVLIIIKPIYLGIVYGNIMAYMCTRDKIKKIDTITSSIVLICSIFFAGYPSGIAPNNYYRILDLSRFGINSVVLYHVIGATLLLYILLSNEENIKGNYQVLWLKRLDDISFSVYLVHNLVISFPGCYIMKRMLTSGYTYHIAALSSSIIVLLLSLLCAVLSTKYIEKPCAIACDYILKKIKFY